MALDMAIKAIIAISQKGFEQEAYHEIMRATARKNIITFTAALLKTGCVGYKGEGILPNMKFDEITVEHYNAVVFVSGGASAYHNNPLALKLVKEFYEQGKVVAAVGDAIPILANAGVLNGKRIACDDAEKEIVSSLAEIVDEGVSVDGRIVTAKSGFAKDFAEKLSDVLVEIGIQKFQRKGVEL